MERLAAGRRDISEYELARSGLMRNLGLGPCAKQVAGVLLAEALIVPHTLRASVDPSSLQRFSSLALPSPRRPA
eukprot:CAMPEP_0184383718 /NCGR_PEP_ID=MMETSP0007-20130409/7362_1 /TAXON_ID=97485 /ORGANISM="Prymnesium parvum, Strain Texoma1" /LENGTH=73 /DNA_ID=CAMNT_0026730315 /DNA_START=406 /DNA_END=624 /DNA_ORIENTATION=+